jgi:hypothetical protein
MAQQYKAVIFDLGGVAHEYTKPKYMQTLQAFRKYISYIHRKRPIHCSVLVYEPGKEQLANDWRGWEMGTVTAEALIRRNIEITGPEVTRFLPLDVDKDPLRAWVRPKSVVVPTFMENRGLIGDHALFATR